MIYAVVSQRLLRFADCTELLGMADIIDNIDSKIPKSSTCPSLNISIGPVSLDRLRNSFHAPECCSKNIAWTHHRR